MSASTGFTPSRRPRGRAASSRWRSWPGAAELRGHASRSPPSRRASRGWPGLCLLAIVVTGGYNAWAQLGGLSRLWNTAYGSRPDREAPDRRGAGVAGGRQPLRAPATARAGAGRPRRRRAGVSHVTPRPLRSQPRRAVSAGGVTARRLRHDRSARRPRRVRVHGRPGRSHAGAPRPVRAQADDARRRLSRGPVEAGRGRHRDAAARDAAHGRAVFARLECATCHAIPDAQFSAPIRPGPDLAGIGGRHPGEIVESIMNPNAQILDGPGYTNEQGLSTMPDYRDRLTVRGADRPGRIPERLRSARGTPHRTRHACDAGRRGAGAARDTGAGHARTTDAHAVSRATRERQA